MKYTLQVNQIAAHGIGIQDKIDLIDLCLFDSFKSFANSAKCEKMIDDNGIWFWISYAEIIRELPLANIKTKDGIYRRMLKLRDAGLIVFHANNQKATKTYFQWGVNYDAMERTDWEERPTDKKPQVVKDLRMKNRSTYGQETVAPTDEKPYNQTTINQTTKTKGEGDTPPKILSNLKEEKEKTPKVALKGSTHVGNYEPSEFDMYGIQPLEILEGDDIAEIEAAALKENNGVWDIIKKNSDPETAPVFSNNEDAKNAGLPIGARFTPPTHIVTEITEDPTIKVVTGMNLSEAAMKTITFPAATPNQWREASKEIQPIARAETILEAEEKILNWAKTHGLETLKFRHITAKRKFVEDDLPALVAHYVSVFASTNEASRANLMRDPVANFEAGMFKYLTMQNTIDRNNATTKPGTQSQQPGQTKNKAILNHWGADPTVYNEKQKF